ncbi:hypothetical protein ACLB2K_027173 [Fragaria x ananassa]
MSLRSSIMVLLMAVALCGPCYDASVVAGAAYKVGGPDVIEQGYESCDLSSPITAYSSGLDTITLGRPGHYYFLCGVPSDCDAGQKVEVVVNNLPTPADSRLVKWARLGRSVLKT